MKNGNIKRLLALALASVMVLTATGCGSPAGSEGKTTEPATQGQSAAEEELYYNVEGFPIVKEPITVTMAGLQEGNSDWENAHVLQKIESEMGINIEATPYVDTTAVKTQFAAQIASDTLPDILWGYSAIDKATANQYGEDGYLLDWTDYLDIMPNFARFLEENPEFAATHTTEDGSIYSIDRVRVETLPQDAIYVSKADQEKYGFSVEDIKTVEDFYEVLKSIKEQNPDVIPYAFTSSGFAFRSLPIIRTAFGIQKRDLTWMLNVDENGQVVLDDITENGRAYYTYMNRLWEEGLVDEEAYVITQDEYNSKVRNGEYVFWFNWSYLQYGLGAEDGSCYEDYDCLVALTSEYNETPTYILADPCNMAARCMVSAKTEYPEAIMRLMDYMFTDEGYNFFQYGTEGETYDWVETPMGDKIVSHENYWDKNNYASASDWLSQSVKLVNIFSIKQPADALAAVQAASDEKLDDYIYEDDTYAYVSEAFMEKAIREQVEVRKYTNFLPVVLTAEESKSISQLESDVKNLLGQFAAQFVTGELDPETDWDSYVEQIKVFWDQIQPTYQAAYDRMNANK